MIIERCTTEFLEGLDAGTIPQSNFNSILWSNNVFGVTLFRVGRGTVHRAMGTR